MRRVFAAVLMLAAFGCGPDEKACEKNGTGELQIGNGYATQFEVLLNGVSYGVVNPGTIGKVSVPAGGYTMETEFVGGGVACGALDVNISECSSQGFSCEP